MLGRYALVSISLHALVFLAATLGLLNYETDVVDFPVPVSIELIDLIEDTAKTIEPPKPIQQKEKPKPKEELTPKPKQEVTQPEPQPVPDPKPADPEIKADPILAPPPKQKPKPPKKAQENEKDKAQEKPKAKPKKNKELDFDALLKNLTKDDVGQKQSAGHLSDHLSASILDAVRKQIESEWRLPAGIRDSHKHTVTIQITMNPDRTVQSATLDNSSRTNDPSYQMLAESALRAVERFKTKPLKLPVNQYKTWKRIKMQFDPRQLM